MTENHIYPVVLGLMCTRKICPFESSDFYDYKLQLAVALKSVTTISLIKINTVIYLRIITKNLKIGSSSQKLLV